MVTKLPTTRMHSASFVYQCVDQVWSFSTVGGQSKWFGDFIDVIRNWLMLMLMLLFLLLTPCKRYVGISFIQQCEILITICNFLFVLLLLFHLFAFFVCVWWTRYVQPIKWSISTKNKSPKVPDFGDKSSFAFRPRFISTSHWTRSKVKFYKDYGRTLRLSLYHH